VEWLKYAALDVEVLIELRDALADQLAEHGKTSWAEQEFAAILAARPAPPRPDPWRRTSGIHRVRSRRGLAIVRELWAQRDVIAQRRDISPSKILPDTAIVEAAREAPGTLEELGKLAGFGGRGLRRYGSEWLRAIRRAKSLADDQLPESSAPPGDGPPPAHRWAERDPVAARRLAALRAAVAALADAAKLPTENLLAPDAVRRLAWQPPEPPSQESIAAQLRRYGARDWQIEITTVPMAMALLRLAEKGEA
jgi:ribonuclease D